MTGELVFGSAASPSQMETVSIRCR